MLLPDITYTVPVTLAKTPVKWLKTQTTNFYHAKIRKLSYVFEEYTKHITVYKDGHGVLMTNMVIRVLDDETCTTLKRRLSIRDAARNTMFDKIADMQKTPPHKRFSEQGFWFGGNDIVSDIQPVVDDCGKEISWKFLFDKAKLKHLKGKTFSLSYAFSIPKLYPIDDGFFDENNAGDVSQSTEGYFSSGLQVNHKQNKFTYIVALEKNIEVLQHPSFCIFPRGEDQGFCEEKPCEDRSDLFYNRYVATLQKPEIGTKISVRWKIKPKP